MDILTTIVVSLFLIGIVSAGVTEFIKKILVILVFDNDKPKGKDKPKWWLILNVSMAILIGALIGPFVPLEMPFDVLTGLSGGIMAALLYRQAKRLVRGFKASMLRRDSYGDDEFVDDE